MLYPPFATICLVGFVSENGKTAEQAAGAFTDLLTCRLSEQYRDMPVRLLGPAPAAVFKVSNKYRYKLIIKCRNDARFREMLANMLIDFAALKEYHHVTVYADIDPLSI